MTLAALHEDSVEMRDLSFVGQLSPTLHTPESIEERKKMVCSWNGSLVHVTSSSVNATLLSIKNSSMGGLSVENSMVTIIHGLFEGNNPSIDGYPSARRNILCTSSFGNELNVSSLKGGDGQERNTSLWILNDACILTALPTTRSSPFFIPSISSATNTSTTSHITFSFIGTLLFPCNLAFSLATPADDAGQFDVIVEEHPFATFVNETSATGNVERTGRLSDANARDGLAVSLIFGDLSLEPRGRTEWVVIVPRALSVPNTSSDPSVQGGSAISNWTIIPFVVVSVLLAMILIVNIICLLRKRKQRHPQLIQKDEEIGALNPFGPMLPPGNGCGMPRSESEECLLARDDFGNIIGGEQQHTQHNTPPSSQTIPLNPQPQRQDPTTSLTPPKLEISVNSPQPSTTTSSMNSLVEGMECDAPFGQAIVDERDSVYVWLREKETEWSGKEIEDSEKKMREKTAGKVLYWTVNGLMHLMERGKEKEILKTFTSHDIFFGGDGAMVIGLHRFGLTGDEETKGKMKPEMHRWVAPEVVREEVSEATEGTLSFAIGLILYEMMLFKMAFDELDGQTAGVRLSEGKMPWMGWLEGSGFETLIQKCLDVDGSKRPLLAHLKREFHELLGQGPPKPSVDSDGEDESSSSSDG